MNGWTDQCRLWRTTGRPRHRAARRQASLRWLKSRDLLTKTIDFPEFRESSGPALVGDASLVDEMLRRTPAEGRRRGAASYTAEEQIVSVAWEITCGFSLNGNFGDVGGPDRFAFALQHHRVPFLADVEARSDIRACRIAWQWTSRRCPTASSSTRA